MSDKVSGLIGRHTDLELQTLVDLLAGIEHRGEIGRRSLVVDEVLQLDLRVVVGIVKRRQIQAAAYRRAASS